MTTAKLYDVEEASATVARLLTALPCAQTMLQLEQIDPFALSPSDRIDYLSALERQDGWLYAPQATSNYSCCRLYTFYW